MGNAAAFEILEATHLDKASCERILGDAFNDKAFDQLASAEGFIEKINYPDVIREGADLSSLSGGDNMFKAPEKRGKKGSRMLSYSRGTAEEINDDGAKSTHTNRRRNSSLYYNGSIRRVMTLRSSIAGENSEHKDYGHDSKDEFTLPGAPPIRNTSREALMNNDSAKRSFSTAPPSDASKRKRRISYLRSSLAGENAES